MVSTPVAAVDPPAPVASREAILLLLAQLVQQLMQPMQSSSSQPLPFISDLDEVLLQIEIDGLDYSLVRSQPRLAQPMLLSPREWAVARLVAQGHPNKHISSILGISPWTVSTYLRRIFTKLGVTSRTAMVTRLMESNLLEVTESQGQAARMQPHSPLAR